MSTTITTAEDRKPSIGQFRAVTRTYDDDDQVIGVHRGEVLLPGRFTAENQWEATDVSGQPASIQQAATEMWTADAIAACKAANPWVPPPPPQMPELQPYQFFAMLEISGKKAALDAFIDALPAQEKAVARAKLDHAFTFHRQNDLVLDAQQAIGLTGEQLDALWTQAAAL